MNILERMKAKHNSAAGDVQKLALKRDKALDALIRAELRYRKAIKTVARSSKRLDKLREEQRVLREKAKAERAADHKANSGKSAEQVFGI